MTLEEFLKRGRLAHHHLPPETRTNASEMLPLALKALERATKELHTIMLDGITPDGNLPSSTSAYEALGDIEKILNK